MVNNAGMELRMGKFHFKSFGLYTILLAVIALCIVYTPPIAVRQVSASPPGTEVIMINPATGNTNFTFYIEVTQTGTRFNATVWLYNVTDLFAFQVYLVANDTLLNITNAWVPSWDSSYVFYGKTTVPTPPAFYDDDGDGIVESVLVGSSILGAGSFTGSGLLAIIELEIIYVPETGEETTNLNINNPDTFLLDTTQSDIEATKTDGLYILTEDNIPPVIGTPQQDPPEVAMPGQPVKVTVNVTDAETGVQNVTLLYQNNTEWYSIPMEYNATSELWQATIPGFDQIGLQVKYIIEAYDNADNHAVNDNAGEYFVYEVIPELTLVFVLALLTILSMLTIILTRKPKRKP